MKSRVLAACLTTAQGALARHPLDGRAKRHYCFVVQRGTVLGWGCNRRGDPPSGRGYGHRHRQNIHAEPDAWRRVRPLVDPGRPWEAVNIRLNRRGAPRLAAPCRCCAAFLAAMGCRRAYFSTEAGWASVEL